MPHENIKLWNGVMDVMWDEGYLYLRREQHLFGKPDGRDLYHEQFPTGAIIATAELVECWHMVAHPGTDIDVGSKIPIGAELDVPKKHPRFHDYIVPTEQELLFGDWTPGRYAWELADVQILPRFIPARGRPGFWEWEER